ncbi:MAG: hypothetical protein RLZZ241_297 [Bacteroidota bacterium]|jgi:heme-degrading monooxygenase HmoA
MVLELASIKVIHGKEQDFENAINKAQDILIQAEGYVSHEFKKCVEVQNHYILLITWKSLEDHTEGFRKSELFKEWRALIGSFFEEAPEVLHYNKF